MHRSHRRKSAGKSETDMKRTNLLESESANRAFANASEIEGALMLDDIGYLRIAIGRAVLEVVNNATILIESERK